MNKNFDNKHYNKELKPLARKLRREMTKAEVKIWNDLLRKKQLFGLKFLRQRTISDYIVDFFCKEINLIIEIDGYSHHFEKVFDNDVKRQKELEELGFTVLRFSDDEVVSDFNNVCRTLEIWLTENKYI